MNLPGAALDLPSLVEHDKQVLRFQRINCLEFTTLTLEFRWAVDNDADYVAASFIRTATNVRSYIAYLERYD